MALTLYLLGEDRQIHSEELDSTPSLHTGRPLRNVHIWVDVPAALSAELTDAFNDARDYKHALPGDDGIRWVVVGSHSSSHTGDDPNRHHQADLREVEEVNAARLEFLGLTLEPSRYKEERSDEAEPLLVSAIVDAEAGLSEQLEAEIMRDRDNDPYFEVVRLGVNDEPVRMRFGHCLWQAVEGSGRRHLLRLVSEAGDDDSQNGWLLLDEPERTNVARRAVAAEAGIVALLEALEEVGTLTSEVVEGIRRRINEALDSQGWTLARTLDVERYF